MRWLLAIFLFQLSATCVAMEFAAPRQVDERRAGQAGLRKIVGRHLRLYTDLPASDAVDELAAVFDAAVPQWAEYFRIDARRVRNWQMQGFLIQDRQKFVALGLMPKENPEFVNGFCNGYELWLVDQPSDYFRRHLLLHEGTHGFMYTVLGDTGPGWYAEGMAELLGTHRWRDGQLSMRVMPASRAEVPMWGRIKLIRDAQQAGSPLELSAVMGFNKSRTLSTDEYAWCWGLCAFLDSHPRWQSEFRKLSGSVAKQNFNRRFRNTFRKEWPELLTEWRGYVATLDYGYDAGRMAMQHKPSEAVVAGAKTMIAADRGWQSTGWLFRAGQKCRVTAEGRYRIAVENSGEDDGEPWPCEPGGVTLEYHAGNPLGMLLGAWRSTVDHSFSAPIAIGLGRTLEPETDAVLYLRVNDSPAQLADNRGRLTVRVSRAAD